MRPALILSVLESFSAEPHFTVMNLSFCPTVYAVSLETVLAGHENWVYGIHWQPSFSKGVRTDVLQLIIITVSV